MKLRYISPSILPSRTANSVHVIMQCEAFSKLGTEVTLYAKRDVADTCSFFKKLKETYGVDFSNLNIELISYYSHNSKAVNIRIACMAVKHLLTRRSDIIISRNLYASYVLAILFRKPIIFETHQLEYGVRKAMQKALICSPWVTTIVISRKLVAFLQYHHKCSLINYLVLHDAAPSGILPIPDNEDRHGLLKKLLPELAEKKLCTICGYFGHLYQGRGIEIIEKMAIERPQILFLVVGGNPDDVEMKRTKVKSDNLFYAGHLPHPIAQRIMKLVDVLLMPYQSSVSIGVKNHDTAKWMSPMKMFEYMASGVPLIASDLPVLREVLTDRKNSLLVSPTNLNAWLEAMDGLIDDKELAASIGAKAHIDYLEKFTWDRRAAQILKYAKA